MATATPARERKIKTYDEIRRETERDLNNLENKVFNEIPWGQKGTDRSLAWEYTLPANLDDTKYAGPLDHLKNLKKGWDGQGSDPLTPLLIEKGEEFWNSCAPIAVQNPKIWPGGDNFILFHWKDEDRDKWLKVSIYEDEGSLTCDWLLKTPTTQYSNEDVDFNLEFFRNLVDYYNEI